MTTKKTTATIKQRRQQLHDAYGMAGGGIGILVERNRTVQGAAGLDDEIESVVYFGRLAACGQLAAENPWVEVRELSVAALCDAARSGTPITRHVVAVESMPDGSRTLFAFGEAGEVHREVGCATGPVRAGIEVVELPDEALLLAATRLRGTMARQA